MKGADMQEVFEKIIEAIRKNSLFMIKPDGYGEDCISEHTAIEIVKQEAEKRNNGWILCSERMPEPIRPVLVTLRNWMNDKYFVRAGRFHIDHWKTDDGIVENSVVLAWQPLPAPYQPKGE